MCKLLGLTLGTILLTTFLYGQPIRMEEIRQEIWKEKIIKFKIKSVTSINSKGRVKSKYFYDDFGNVSRIESNSDSVTVRVLIYDSARKLIEKRIINSKGQIYRFITYFYNSSGQLIKMDWTDSDKRSEGTWTYDYDRDGNKIKETQESKLLGYKVTKFTYVNGRLSVSETSDDLLRKSKRVSYKYNRSDQVKKEKMIDYSWDNFTSTLIYSYNNAGNLVTLKQKYNGASSSYMIYQYNERGLLETEIWKNLEEKESDKTTYIVSY